MTKNSQPSRPLFSFIGKDTRACFHTACLVQNLYFKILNREVEENDPLFSLLAEKMEKRGLRIIAPQWFANCFVLEKEQAV